MSIQAHSQPPALSQCPAPPLLVSVKPRKCGKNQEKRLICINLEPGNPGAAELGLQGRGAAFFGGDIPKRSPLFQEKLCWLLTCSQVKPGWEAQHGLKTFPKKTGAGFSWKILLEVPGSLPWKPSVAKGSRARKFQVFGAAGSGFPPARKNLWNGGIRARGAVGFGAGTEQSPPRLKLNLFGVKQPPKNSFGANPPLSTPVPQFPHPG